MKRTKKTLAILLSLTLCFAAVSPALAADAADAITITNPYADVDWDTVHAYKTALHSHTNASDGRQTLKDSIGRHLETGFDIVAVTDHGTVDYGWAEGHPNGLIHGVLRAVKRSDGDLVGLGGEGTFADGTAYVYGTDASGDDYLRTADGRTILRVPFGIEQNAVSVNAHVNSWFTDFHDNSVTTYRDAVRGVNDRGGVCVINHPGEYTKARYELRSEDAYDESDPAYRYYVNKFAALLDQYPACIGVDVNSKGDNRTRFDRILWDKLLTRFAADGRNVFAIASSDAHQLDVIDTGFVTALMPALTSAALRQALTKGEFFAASHCIGNPDELTEIADALEALYGETAVGTRVREAADRIAAKAEAVESGKEKADEDLGETYRVLDGEGHCTAGTQPAVTRIEVDDAENTVAVRTENALLARLISNGKTVASVRADDAVFDLDDYADRIGDYVRIEIFGEGGIVYTQAFLLNAAQNAGTSPVVPAWYPDLGVLDFLLAIFHRVFAVIQRFFAATFR